MTSEVPIDYTEMFGDTWRRLMAAASDPSHPMRLCSVASVATHGAGARPDVRLLMLRGASTDLGKLWFHTDSRAHKVHQIRLVPLACVLCWDPRDGVQLRIDGNVVIHQDTKLAQHHWEQLELATRYGYTVSSPPGAELPHPDPRADRYRKSLQESDVLAGREHFAVFEVDVQAIDWLQLSDLGDRRATMKRKNDWLAVPLTP
jgi:general stress protein 26